MRRVGTLRAWMELHVFAGLLGPTFIAFHSAFLFTSPIAILASISLAMLVVTGLLGRYIYSLVPHTVSGAEENAESLMAQMQFALTRLKTQLGEMGKLIAQIERLTPRWQLPRGKLLSLALVFVMIVRSITVRMAMWKILRNFRKRTPLSQSEYREIARAFRRVVLLKNETYFFKVFQRLLQWWRGLHLYFALLMVITVLIHIIIAVYGGARWVF